MSTSDRRSAVARLGDLPVLVKILSAVVVTLVVGVAVGVLALTRLSAAASNVDEMHDGQVKPLAVLAEAQRTEMQTRLDLLNLLITQDPAGMAKNQDALKQHDEELATTLASYRTTAADPGAVDAFTAEWAKVSAFRDGTMVPLALAKDIPGYEAKRDSGYLPLVKSAEANLVKAFDAESAEASKRATASRDDYRSARTTILLGLLLGGAVALGIGSWVARQITRNVSSVGRVASALAAGDLTVSADVDTRDELGVMASQLDAAVGTIRGTVETLERSAISLSGSSEELSATAGQIAAAAEETGAQASVVSASATQVSTNIATVATSSEEMRASIQEIAGNSSEAAGVAAQAVALAGETTTTVTRLGSSSAEIGDVVRVIASIAEQTNLLALNATIEAARAGEAGKGFAVVANEVKELAQETARATDDIGRRVEAIQGDTGAAVAAIERITEVIGRISDYQATIASAVEEQTATTSEVVRNVAEAAAGATQIADNVEGVAESAQTTSAGVAQSQAAASELAQMSSELRQLVSRFRV